MIRERIVETNEGIQGEIDTEDYDIFMRHMRDKGWLETNDIIKTGIVGGDVLEIGSGPGYLGLEWLKKAKHGRLTGLELSPNMIRIAKKNAMQYGYNDHNKCKYVHGNAMEMPFTNNHFDAVISSGSLHEWEDPIQVFNEMFRVLKDDGCIFVSDLKRNTSFAIRTFLTLGAKKPSMKSGLKSSLNAAYTANEIKRIVDKTMFQNTMVKTNPFGLIVCCKKIS